MDSKLLQNYHQYSDLTIENISEEIQEYIGMIFYNCTFIGQYRFLNCKTFSCNMNNATMILERCNIYDSEIVDATLVDCVTYTAEEYEEELAQRLIRHKKNWVTISDASVDFITLDTPQPEHQIPFMLKITDVLEKDKFYIFYENDKPLDYILVTPQDIVDADNFTFDLRNLQLSKGLHTLYIKSKQLDVGTSAASDSFVYYNIY